jgi:hypothetical protein
VPLLLTATLLIGVVLDHDHARWRGKQIFSTILVLAGGARVQGNRPQDARERIAQASVAPFLKW